LAKEQKKQEQEKKDQDAGSPDDESDSVETPEQEESQETEEGEGSSQSEESETGEETEDTQAGQGSEGDESEESEESETGEGSESDEEGDEEGEDLASSSGEQAADSKSDEVTPDRAQTVADLEKNLNGLVEQSSVEHKTVTLPKIPEGYVFGIDFIEGLIKGADAAVSRWYGNKVGELGTMGNRAYKVWETANAADVRTLWTEFERRKAADAHRRAMESDTGVIDPNRLHAYRISDEIFLRSTTIRDGKNHGLVILFDMSGSMIDKMLDSMIQLVNFAAFARRANIPFVVYGFMDWQATYGNRVSVAVNPKEWNTLRTDIPSRLVTLLQSGMSHSRWQNVAGGLLAWAASLDYNGADKKKNPYTRSSQANEVYTYRGHFSNNNVCLRGTPTNHALMACLDLVPKFRKDHRVQVVNTIIITDGEASDSPLTAHGDCYTGRESQDANYTILDPVTRRTYPVFRRTSSTYATRLTSMEQQKVLVNVLRDRMGGENKVINVNLVTAPRYVEDVLINQCDTAVNSEKSIDSSKDSMKDKGYVAVKGSLFDEVVIVQTNHASGYEGLIEKFHETSVTSESKASVRKVGTAWIKALEATKGNRALMTHLATLISK
jgi:hypothetical protein